MSPDFFLTIAAHLGGEPSRPNKKPAVSSGFPKRMKGLEPSTFCMASRRSSQLSYIREAAPL